MDITKFTDTELKAFGYEQVLIFEQTQNNLKIIADELKKRKQQEPSIDTTSE